LVTQKVEQTEHSQQRRTTERAAHAGRVEHADRQC
jgi:hypothetical protein